VKQIELPDQLPLRHQDIEIMRCTTCGAIVPGVWNVTRKTMRAGIDHVLDRHSTDLAAGQLRPPLFVNCAVQDPFWLEEQTGDSNA
jgi:hypothetical protein